MKTLTSPHVPKLGSALSDAELATFAGGVTEGGCVPDPMKDFPKKLGVGSTISVVIQQ